jgi:hypothetical protein
MELMSNIFFPMLAGHLIADFWLQPTSWVRHKQINGWKSTKLLIHSAIASLLPVLFILRLDVWWFFPVIFFSHYIFDVVKSKRENTIFSYIVDQFLHITILAILSVSLNLSLPDQIAIFWIYFSGLILVTQPLGILVGKFLNVITKAGSEKAKLDASAWIGILERILIVIFVSMLQFQAIGFLVAAKSIYRFSDTHKDGAAKAEYYLLGTLFSFTLAIITGLAISWLTGQ